MMEGGFYFEESLYRFESTHSEEVINRFTENR